MERKRRSLAKAISWRIIAFIVTAGLTYRATGSTALALSVGFLDSLIKFVVYYFHERAWSSISFGLIPAKESTTEDSTTGSQVANEEKGSSAGSSLQSAHSRFEWIQFPASQQCAGLGPKTAKPKR